MDNHETVLNQILDKIILSLKNNSDISFKIYPDYFSFCKEMS